MKKIVISLTVIFMSLMMTNLAYAGSGWGGVQIEHVGIWNDKNIVFFYTSDSTNKPQCNTYNNRWTINLNTEAGKAQYSLILAAQTAGTRIRVLGLNTCNLWSNSEDVHWVGYEVNLNN